MSIRSPQSEIRNGLTGTREWSEHSVNCCLGCRHGCLYCYARYNAVRRGKISAGDDWIAERPEGEATASMRRRKYEGTVMFPTQHDITAGNAVACRATLAGLLRAGNRVLVVSKAGEHVPLLLQEARQLARRSAGTLELRVTLTAFRGETAAFWEPGAPTPSERAGALWAAHRLGIPTSVAIEPLLEPDLATLLVSLAVGAGVQGEIWIGAANHLRARTAWCRGRPGLDAEIERIEAGQTAGRMREIYQQLKGNPQIRWKDSYQRALGIDALGVPVRAVAGPEGAVGVGEDRRPGAE
jgi:hypothetical protein